MKHRFAVAIGAAIALGSGLATAEAPTKSSCIAAASEGQKLRRAGSLRASRERFAICSQEACPDIVRADCIKWTAEVLQSVPSIVVRVRDGGRDVLDAQIAVDDHPIASTEQGKPIDVDPGAHVVSVPHGADVVKQSVVVATGEKNRLVTIELAPVKEPPPIAPPVTEPPIATSRPTPVLVYVLGAVGIGGGISFGAFALHGRSRFDDLDHECSPRCDPSRVSSVKTEIAIADVSLAIGIVALGVATVLYLARPTVEERRATALFKGR